MTLEITALVTMYYSWNSIPTNPLFHDHRGYHLSLMVWQGISFSILVKLIANDQDVRIIRVGLWQGPLYLEQYVPWVAQQPLV